MALPRTEQWDVVDWSEGRLTDPLLGLMSQVGSLATAQRPGMLSVGSDGLTSWVQLVSNDGLPSDCVLNVAVPRRFTVEFTGVFSPPTLDDANPSLVLAVGAQDRGGRAGLVFLGAGSQTAWLQVPPSGASVRLGQDESSSASAAIARGEPVTFRMVVNGDTGVMTFYATPRSVLLAGGQHVLRAMVPAPVAPAGVVPASNLMDYFSAYACGTSDNPSSIRLYDVRVSGQLLEPVRPPRAVVRYEALGGIGERVVLDGSQSSDAGRRQLTYQWRLISQPAGSSVAFTGAQRATAALWPLVYTAIRGGFSGNGAVVRITEGSAFSVEVVPDTGLVPVVLVTVAVLNGLTTTCAKDVVAALGDRLSLKYNAAAAKIVAAAIAQGASGNAVVETSSPDLVLSGGADASEVVASFVPSVVGEYEVGLVVSNGSLSSAEEVAAIRVEDARLVTGYTPDASYLWTYLSDFWGLVQGKEPIETFWSAFIQKTAGALLDVVQAMDERSISSFPAHKIQRWKALQVREALPGSTILDAPTSAASVLPYDNTGEQVATGVDVGFLTDRFWANGNAFSVGDLVSILGAVYRVVDVVQTETPEGDQDLLCTVDRAGIPVFELLDDGNLSGRGSPDLEREMALLGGVNATTSVLRTAYGSFGESRDVPAEQLYVWLQGVGVPGRARLVSSWAQDELRLALLADEISCVPAHNFTTGMKLISRLPGTAGNGWWVVFRSGSQLKITRRGQEKVFDVEFAPGDTAADLADALSIPQHRSYDADAARTFLVYPGSVDLALQAGALCLDGFAEAEELGWKLLRRRPVQAVRGLTVAFGSYDDRGVFARASHGLSVFEGDRVEFADGNVGAVATVIGVGPDSVITCPAMDLETLLPTELSAGAAAAFVLHTTRLQVGADVLSIPVMQHVLDIDNRLVGTSGDPRLHEGTHYRVADGWVSVVADAAADDAYDDPVVHAAGIPQLLPALTVPDRLWAEVVILSNDVTLGSNFGVLVGFPKEAFTQAGLSVSYLSAVRGVMFTLFRGPSLTNIRIGGQIFCNLPFAEKAGTVIEVDPDYDLEHQLWRVQLLCPPNGPDVREDEQSVYTYEYPRRLGVEMNPGTGLPIAVGDDLTEFQPICKGVRVDDYLTSPSWFRGYGPEVQKFHTFRVLVDSEMTSSTTVDLLSLYMKATKPSWQKVVVGVMKTCVDERDLADSRRAHVKIRLHDDRYSCEDESVVGGYTQRFDDVDGGGSTWNASPALPAQQEPRTKIDRAQLFDQSVGSTITLPTALLGPPAVRAALGVNKGRWDHRCDVDQRQKSYCDRRVHYGPASHVDVRVGTYMPVGRMYPGSVYDMQVASGVGVFSDEDARDFSAPGISFPGSLVVPGLTVMLVNDTTGEVVYDVVLEVAPGGVSDTLRLTIAHASVDSWMAVVYKKGATGRVCAVVAGAPGEYTLTDDQVVFAFQGVPMTRVRVGMRVLVDTGSDGPVAVVTALGENTLTVAGTDLPDGETVSYRVLQDSVGPAAVQDALRDYWMPDGTSPVYDSIFRYDCLVAGAPDPSPTMQMLGPPAARSWILDGAPNTDSGYYTWFDWKLLDWPRGADGQPVPGSEPPFILRQAPEVGTNGEATHWQPNAEATAVENVVACTVVGSGNGVQPRWSTLKNPAPVPQGVEGL